MIDSGLTTPQVTRMKIKIASCKNHSNTHSAVGTCDCLSGMILFFFPYPVDALLSSKEPYCFGDVI